MNLPIEPVPSPSVEAPAPPTRRVVLLSAGVNLSHTRAMREALARVPDLEVVVAVPAASRADAPQGTLEDLASRLVWEEPKDAPLGPSYRSLARPAFRDGPRPGRRYRR